MLQNQMNLIVESIVNAPLWVQEVIFMSIKKSIEELLPRIAYSKDDEIYPLYVPELTFKGRQVIEKNNPSVDMNVYKYLKAVSQGQRVVDITLNNFWTLEESSVYLAECLENEYIKAPQKVIIEASILYLGGKIRLGEYIKKIDKINVEQLDGVLRQQKRYNDENPNDPKKIGEVLLSMGYVANDDIDKILYIKNESKKRFLVTAFNNPTKQIQQVPVSSQENLKIRELQAQIDKLTHENNLLKNKLRAIFNLQNKNKS